LLEEHEKARQKRDRVIAPVLQLYEKHNVEGILKKYSAAAMQGYSGKKMLMHAEELFSELVSDMRCIGFNVEAFDRLQGVARKQAQLTVFLMRRSVAIARTSGCTAAQRSVQRNQVRVRTRTGNTKFLRPDVLSQDE